MSQQKFRIKYYEWDKEDAIKLTNKIKDKEIGIFGEDVYKLPFDRLEPLYDNWFCLNM